MVVMMKDLEMDPRSINLIKRCMIVLKRISDLEMDLKLLPINKRAMIVRNAKIGQNVSGNLQRPAAGKQQPSDENHQDCNDAQNSAASASDGTDSRPSQNRAYPPVAAFTAQCSICSKWRRLPSEEKLEEINEHIL